MHRRADNQELVSLLFGAFSFSRAWLTALPNPTMSPAEVGGGNPLGLYKVDKAASVDLWGTQIPCGW